MVCDGQTPHIIIGMPPHIIMHGIPFCIIDIIMFMRSFIISICEGSMGIIRQIIPSLPISHVILHIIGIMPVIGIIIGIGIGMPIIMFGIGDGAPQKPIIGPVAGIVWFMPIIGIICCMWFIIGIAFIMVTASYVRSVNSQAREPHARCFPLLARTLISTAG